MVTVPLPPLFHLFVDRLVDTSGRKFLGNALSWTATDLDRKLAAFQGYHNAGRVHPLLSGARPAELDGE